MEDEQQDDVAAAERGRRAREHARALTKEFNDVEIDVIIHALAMFAYHVWATALQPEEITLSDYATELGRAIGMQHDIRLQLAREADRPTEH